MTVRRCQEDATKRAFGRACAPAVFLGCFACASASPNELASSPHRPVPPDGAIATVPSSPSAASAGAPDGGPSTLSETAPMTDAGLEPAPINRCRIGTRSHRVRVQRTAAPSRFLIRSNYLSAPGGNARSVRYRTQQYGAFKDAGAADPGVERAAAFVVPTTFMGLPIRLHRKVVPALKCVEERIRAVCTDHPYAPRALAGIRSRNTYRKGEVTSHVYGIAIDIDPDRNPCCGCVKPWRDVALCRVAARSDFERMVMPECWVHAFESFGFYWLGHDVLRDTMHFEFLGDPDHAISRKESHGNTANAKESLPTSSPYVNDALPGFRAALGKPGSLYLLDVPCAEA